MANRNQLRVLTDEQGDALRALGNGLAVAEIVKIHWPAPDGPKCYAWWNLLTDPLYAGSALETWLDGAPLITAFVPTDQDKLERFHEIPRTAAIGDDVVRMRFQNRGRVFEDLLATHKAGVKVEIFYYLPQLDGGTAVHWFSGHLRTPESVRPDFVEVSVAEGLRSPDLLLPNRVHAGQCTWAAQFNGRFPGGLPGNPCDYGVGGRGLGSYTDCGGSKEDCLARMGDLESYGGFDAVTDTSTIGSGSRTTVSETQGQTTRLKQPVQVCYGEGRLNSLPLLDFAKEFNPSPKHQDKGTIRALFEISEGPIEEVTEFELMDQVLPRADGLGLEVRLGTQRQAPTGYSESVLNYNRLAHARADKNPINPTGIQPSQIVAKCKYQGRNTLRIYSDADSYTEGYSNLRAWVALDLLRDTTYGHREDPARYALEDFVYLAGQGSTFNGVVQGKTARQQFTDICLAGPWFPPFSHQGLTRWLAIEDYDLEAADIPTFTDTGAGRNILVDAQGLARLSVTQKDDDKIPNEITLTFEDAAHKNLERPLLFPDKDQQARAGQAYGDGSLRKVPETYAAFGTSALEDARALGWYLLDFGPFYSGGVQNNAEVEFVTSHLRFPEALELHPNKVFRLVSAQLNNAKNPAGEVFTHFIVKELRTTPRGELLVKAQAYGALRSDTTSGAVDGNTSTGGGGQTQTVADSRFVIIDRLWRDQELAAGVPGFYVAAGPASRAAVWPGFEFYQEVGSYALLHETEAEAVLGEAVSVLAGTTTGTETVDVELLAGQTLPTAGRVWLGGEIFDYGARTQLTSSPNRWRLSTLTNRGARCTEARQSTHAGGEDFALLNAAVRFVALETSEIGLTRNYKGLTAGQALGDVAPVSHTFAAPNFALVTPADYALALDTVRQEVLHSWTPLAPGCNVTTGLLYEIYLDNGAGAPGALLWSGTSSGWREATNAGGARTYHFRVRGALGAGAYEVRTITVDYSLVGVVTNNGFAVTNDGVPVTNT